MRNQRALSAILFNGLLLAANQAYAGVEDLKIGEPALGGSGCARGSARVEVDPDAQVISIIYDQLAVESRSLDGKRIQRASCSLALPLELPANQRIKVAVIAMEGDASLSENITGRINTEYFLAGSIGKKVTRVIQGPVESPFLIIRKLKEKSLNGPCGGSVIFRNNTSVLLQKSSDEASGLIRLNANAVLTKLKLTLEACE